MAEIPMDTLIKAQEVVKLIKFYREDNDHVLRRRFHRLHLYNLYQKHDSLVQLDNQLLFLESRVKPDTNDGMAHSDAFEQAAKLDSLISQVGIALKEFGMIKLYVLQEL
jgi:hypothetical protein